MLYAVFIARYSQSPVDKLVECCALLGGADGAHDGLPYDVAVLVDNVGGREREQV